MDAADYADFEREFARVRNGPVRVLPPPHRCTRRWELFAAAVVGLAGGLAMVLAWDKAVTRG